MAFAISRLPSTDSELYWYVRMRFGVSVPRTPVCPDHIPPFRAFADAYFGRNSIDPDSGVSSLALWHGSRGLSGKSFMLSLLAVVQAELLGADVNLLGGSYAQSLNIQEHVNSALDYENAPRYMIVQQNTAKITYTNGACIRPLTASQKTVRGPHPPRLLLDEIDEMDIKILDAALGQPLPQRNYLRNIVKPYTVMCSTWQNPQGTFTEIKRRAEERNIPVYQWCFLESANPVDGWLTQEAIAEKKASIPRAMWETEYELNEPSIGNRAFDVAAVDRMFSLNHLPDPFSAEARVEAAREGDIKPAWEGGYLRAREQKDYEEYVYQNPIRGAQYVAGADWAKEKDYTVIAVFRIDVFPYELAYYMKVNRRPYPQMVGFFNKAINRYRAAAIHDATGVGVAVDDYVDTRAQGFLMTGAKRDAMLTEYVSAVESGHFRFPRTPSAYRAHKFAQVGDLYRPAHAATDSTVGAKGKAIFHLPDEVCAFALAYHIIKNKAPLTGLPDMARGPLEPTRLQRELDPPPVASRVGDVVAREETPAGAFVLSV
jgi:hypothetical protein